MGFFSGSMSPQPRQISYSTFLQSFDESAKSLAIGIGSITTHVGNPSGSLVALQYLLPNACTRELGISWKGGGLEGCGFCKRLLMRGRRLFTAAEIISKLGISP